MTNVASGVRFQVRTQARNPRARRFATSVAYQLDVTRRNRLVRRRDWERQLGPKALIKWHAIELGGKGYPAFGCCLALRHLLTDHCQFDILQSGPGRGPN